MLYQKEMDRIILQMVVQIFLYKFVLKMETIYRYQYYNNHNWMKNYENKWAASIVKMNGKVIKNMGYLGWHIIQKTYWLLYLFKESRNQLYKECEITSACSYFTNLLGDFGNGGQEE